MSISPASSVRAGVPLAAGVTLLVSAGDGLALVALAIRAFAEAHAGWAVSVTFLAVTLPVVALSPLAGLVLDRLPTRATLVAAAAWMAAVALALAMVGGLAPTLALATGLGVGAGLMQPGLGIIVPRLVDTGAITRANGYVQAATWGGVTVGPLLAGSLATAGGVRLALEVDAAAYALGALLMACVRLRPADLGAADGDGHWRTRMVAGLSFLRSHPQLAAVVGVVGAMVACLNMCTVAEVVFAEGVLRAGASGYALLVAAWTGAMVVGTLVGGRLPAHRLRGAVLGAATAAGVGVVGAALAGVLWQAVIGYAFGGVANGVEVVATRSLLNLQVPQRLAGRVFSVYSAVLFAASAAGIGVAGALLVPLGPRVVLGVAGAGSVAAGVAGVARWRPSPRPAASSYPTRGRD